jgi:hypothetical protein
LRSWQILAITLAECMREVLVTATAVLQAVQAFLSEAAPPLRYGGAGETEPASNFRLTKAPFEEPDDGQPPGGSELGVRM